VLAVIVLLCQKAWHKQDLRRKFSCITNSLVSSYFFRKYSLTVTPMLNLHR